MFQSLYSCLSSSFTNILSLISQFFKDTPHIHKSFIAYVYRWLEKAQFEWYFCIISYVISGKKSLTNSFNDMQDFHQWKEIIGKFFEPYTQNGQLCKANHANSLHLRIVERVWDINMLHFSHLSFLLPSTTNWTIHTSEGSDTAMTQQRVHGLLK